MITPKRDINVDQNVEACFELARSHLNGLGFEISNALVENPNPKPSKLEVCSPTFSTKSLWTTIVRAPSKLGQESFVYILECFARTDFIGTFCSGVRPVPILCGNLGAHPCITANENSHSSKTASSVKGDL